MAIIDWPASPLMRPSSVQWAQVLPEAVASSVFNQSTQSVVLGQAYWVVTLGIGPRRLTEVQAWEAFLAQLVNTRNRVRLWDWRLEAPRGLGGAPWMAGGGQTGTSINTAGWTPSQAGVLRAGDWAGIAGQLRKVVADATSDAFGVATLTLDQPLRSSPADGTLLSLAKPTALFICTTDKRARGFVQDGARARGPTLEFMEVFA